MCSLKEAQHAHLIRQSQGSVVDVSLLLVRLGRWAVGLTFWVRNMFYQESSVAP